MRCVLLSALALLMPMGLVFGQTPPDAAVDDSYSSYNRPFPDIDLYKEYRFQMGLEASYIDYREPSLEVKERGPFGGIEGSFDWRPDPARSWLVNVLHIDGHTNGGWVDYKSPDGKVSSIPDILAEPRLWLGRDFQVFEFTRWTPYAGIGYRFLYDNFGKASLGYDRISQYAYVPAGFQILTDSVVGWEFGFTAEYDFLIQGWQSTYLSDLDAGFPDINNRQRRGYGIRGSFQIIKQMTNIDLLVAPYVRYWNIKQSDTKFFVNNITQIEYFGFEPANHSLEVGIEFGIQF